MKTTEQYVKSGGLNCPFCESTNICTFDAFESDAGGAWQSVECHDCGKAWRDLYSLTGFEPIGE